MTFNKLTNSVLFYESLYNLFCNILNDLINNKNMSIDQTIYIIQKNIFLNTIETLTII